jgi:hypothetical protein
MPGLLAPMLCIPFKTCSSDVWRGLARVTTIGVGGCVLLLFVAYSNILYRLRIESLYRLSFMRFKKEYQATKKLFTNDEGVEIREPSHKTTFYWKSFQQIQESKDAFLLPIKKSQYILIPKRIFKNPDEMARFSELLVAQTNLQIKEV